VGTHMTLEKFKGIIPALYACYDETGEISEDRTKDLCTYLFEKGVKGLYVGGSSGDVFTKILRNEKQH